MDITLNESDIQKAISAYVSTMGITTVGKTVTAKLSNKRNGGGSIAVVSIEDAGTESSHLLDNATVSEANAARTNVIKQTGTDALGHAAENKEEIPSAPVSQQQSDQAEQLAKTENRESAQAALNGDDVDLPTPTPESAGHETEPKTSLFE